MKTRKIYVLYFQNFETLREPQSDKVVTLREPQSDKLRKLKQELFVIVVFPTPMVFFERNTVQCQ